MINFIKVIILLIFLISCSNVVSPNNNSSTNNNNNITKNMFLKVRIKGESNTKAFYKEIQMYAKDIDFNINNKTYSYTETFNGGYYLCTDKKGNIIDTQKYIFDDKIKFNYNSKDNQKKLNGYIWIGYNSNLFFRNNIDITIPLNNFNDKIYKNTALITITLSPDTKSYTYTFDGFEKN